MLYIATKEPLRSVYSAELEDPVANVRSIGIEIKQ
jgi:hypothetical protein